MPSAKRLYILIKMLIRNMQWTAHQIEMKICACSKSGKKKKFLECRPNNVYWAKIS